MSDPSKTKFSTNILAIAGLITAIGGLLTILHQTTDIFSKNKENSIEQTTYNNTNQLENIDSVSKIRKNDPGILENNPVNGKTNSQITQTLYDDPPAINLSGYWVDTINEGRYLLTQTTTTSFNFQEYSFLEGLWMITAEGIGNLSGNTVQISYNTLFGMPGTFNGILNGKTQITGNAKDLATGFEVAINLIKE